jgi:hypothetical protein
MKFYHAGERLIMARLMVLGIIHVTKSVSTSILLELRSLYEGSHLKAPSIFRPIYTDFN